MVKDIFDIDDIDDLPTNIKLTDNRDVFGNDIIELFRIAKKNGYETLHVNQVVVGLYRAFDKYKDKPKNFEQVNNKLYTMSMRDKYSLISTGKRGIYKLSE